MSKWSWGRNIWPADPDFLPSASNTIEPLCCFSASSTMHLFYSYIFVAAARQDPPSSLPVLYIRSLTIVIHRRTVELGV